MPKIIFKDLCCRAFVSNTDRFIRRQSHWSVIYISINPQVIYLLNRGKYITKCVTFFSCYICFSGRPPKSRLFRRRNRWLSGEELVAIAEDLGSVATIHRMLIIALVSRTKTPSSDL